MIGRATIGLLLAGLLSSRAEAQTLVLCDAEWMDAERVLALIAVEVPDPARFVFEISECREESARLAVRGPDGLDRYRELSLAGTAPEARPRLAALVLVELVRLGARRPAESSADATDAELAGQAEPSAAGADRDASGEAEPRDPRSGGVDRDPSGETEPRDPSADDGPAEAAERTTRELPGPVAEPWESGADVDPPPMPAWYERAPQTAERDAEPSCSASWRLSARGCTRAFEVAVGAARHQLGRRAGGSLWPLQLRLRYRWRFFFVGARFAGRLGQGAPSSEVSVNVGSYTLALGLELASKRFDKVLLAFTASGEVGAMSYRLQANAGGCLATGECVVPTGKGARATIGALLSLRLEVPIRRSAVLLAVEGGFSRGMMVASFGAPVTGLGGGQLSFLLGVAFGAGGAS